MFAQIEITTRCNYHCFYCAGRAMPQRHMAWELFQSIVASLPANCHTLSLQGEGEPTLHPRFWDMVAQVAHSGRTPYTITNGSRIDAALTAQHFPTIGVSLDTIDSDEAHRIGRIHLATVLDNLDKLLACMAPERIIVHTVDHGQPLGPLKNHLRVRGIDRHFIQPLQSKSDYSRRYPERVFLSEERQYTYHCRYLEKPLMRFWNIDGIDMPCCFIKDAGEYISSDHLRLSLAKRCVPDCCAGCRELLAHTPQPTERSFPSEK